MIFPQIERRYLVAVAGTALHIPVCVSRGIDIVGHFGEGSGADGAADDVAEHVAFGVRIPGYFHGTRAGDGVEPSGRGWREAIDDRERLRADAFALGLFAAGLDFVLVLFAEEGAGIGELAGLAFADGGAVAVDDDGAGEALPGEDGAIDGAIGDEGFRRDDGRFDAEGEEVRPAGGAAFDVGRAEGEDDFFPGEFADVDRDIGRAGLGGFDGDWLRGGGPGVDIPAGRGLGADAEFDFGDVGDVEIFGGLQRQVQAAQEYFTFSIRRSQ